MKAMIFPKSLKSLTFKFYAYVIILLARNLRYLFIPKQQPLFSWDSAKTVYNTK